MTIKQENVGGLLRLSIGPKVNWLGLFTALAVILIVSGVGFGPAWEGLVLTFNTGRSPGGFVLGIIACAAIDLFLIYGILLNLAGTELILVSSKDLETRFLICGFVRSQRSFPNSTVEKLRYEQWPGPRGAGMQSAIRFDCVGETVTFARNVTEAESADVIGRMREVYAFPIQEPPEEGSSPAVTHW
jgi:hypothetical protein